MYATFRTMQATCQGISAKGLTSIDGKGNAGFLRERIQAAEPLERHVVIMHDEIHVRPRLTYAGGTIHGLAANTAGHTLSKQVQSYMMGSVFGHMKEVVALIPVQAQDGEFVANSMGPVLDSVHEKGGHVLAIISDNNSINGMAAMILAGHASRQRMTMPLSFVRNGQEIAIMFDAPHIMKTHRNNWVNQVYVLLLSIDCVLILIRTCNNISHSILRRTRTRPSRTLHSSLRTARYLFKGAVPSLCTYGWCMLQSRTRLSSWPIG